MDDFEYDPFKSRSNLRKHGIDFETAQQLWTDPDALVIPARTGMEVRETLIARLEENMWSATFT